MPLPPIPTFHPLPHPDAVVTAGNVRFTVLTDRLIRLEYSPNVNSPSKKYAQGGVLAAGDGGGSGVCAKFEDRPSQMAWHRDLTPPKFRQSVSADRVEVETEALLLRYIPGTDGFSRRNLSITLKRTGVRWRCGDSSRRAGNLKGTARTLDMAAGATRLEDGLFSRKGWAVVDDSSTLVFNGQGWLEPREHPGTDLYFFGYGADFAGGLRDYTRLSGSIPMVPRYILGNWWSRYWAYTQSELQGLMEEFRSHEVPLSVCIVDMDWHITKTGNASSGWTGYTWNRELFPDPPGFVDWLHGQGLRTALNLHPALGVYPHEEQYADLARWMGRDPAQGKPIEFDLTDPRFAEGYFELLHHPQEKMGVDFWWLDWQQGRKSRLPGLDPLWWLNHLHFQDLGRDGRKRPFVFSRWGGLGNHRYPIGFSGDTVILWSSLAFQPYFTATAANVGYGWWSHDIGGHMMRDLTPELYLRWVQFGVFSPIFRLHSTAKPELERRPWGKPEPVYRAAKAAMRLRHALIPYLYSMAWQAHRSGLALVTPMYYRDPDQPAAYRARDQYWFGSELVAAPFLKPAGRSGRSRRKVWLPDGNWTHFFTGQVVKGGWRTVEGGLDDIPVYARAGAIVPLAPETGWGGVDVPDELEVHLFPGADNAFDLYEDDGGTQDYLAGKYAVTPLTLNRSAASLTFTLGPASGELSLLPPERTVHLLLHGVDEGVRASLPGAYDPATRTVRLEAQVVQRGAALTVEFQLPA